MTDPSPPRSLRSLLGRLSNGLVLGAALSGCSALDNCPDGQLEPIVIAGRPSSPEGQLYESTGWNDTLDHFPAKSALAFEHGLGFTPFHVMPYLSFSPRGTNGADGGSVALSAGNQSLIDCVDANVIVLRNDTCEKSFYIRVEAFGRALEEQGDRCTKKAE
jgi:hypothetical protein